MSSYDQIEGFEYWNKEAWKNFVKDYILPLYVSSKKLLMLGQHLSRTVGKTLSAIEKEYLRFLLGGIDSEGNYKENSLARFTKDSFGIYIDSKEYVAYGKEGVNVYDYVKVKSFGETDFVKFLKELSTLSLELVGKVGLKPTEIKDVEIEELIEEPNKILEILGELYERCVQVTANYNYYTFFAISTRNLPYFYMMKAYPKLKENFDELKDFLGFIILFRSEAGIQQVKDIWGHEGGELCDLIFKLNEIIWNNINPYKFSSIFHFISPSIENLKKEYLDKAEEKLKAIGWMEIFPYSSFGFEVSGVYVARFWEYGYGYSCQVGRYEGKSLYEFLNELSPGLFLSYIILTEIRSNYLKFGKREVR
jgi:hypothetical protein